MSERDAQELLLLAIEYLKIQSDGLQNPCVGLYIANCYRRLGMLGHLSGHERQRYLEQARSWLSWQTNGRASAVDMGLDCYGAGDGAGLNRTEP